MCVPVKVPEQLHSSGDTRDLGLTYGAGKEQVGNGRWKTEGEGHLGDLVQLLLRS